MQANGGGLGAKTGLYLIPAQIKKLEELKGKKEKEGGIEFPQRTERKSLCVLTSEGNLARTTNYIDDYGIRKLSPVEAERLQTFPDGFTGKGIDENGKEVIISSSQRYKCLGNSFCVEVIKHILNEFIKNQDIPYGKKFNKQLNLF